MDVGEIAAQIVVQSMLPKLVMISWNISVSSDFHVKLELSRCCHSRYDGQADLLILPHVGGGAAAQLVERATPGEEVPGSIPTVATRSLLVGSVSVLCDWLRQKS